MDRLNVLTAVSDEDMDYVAAEVDERLHPVGLWVDWPFQTGKPTDVLMVSGDCLRLFNDMAWLDEIIGRFKVGKSARFPDALDNLQVWRRRLHGEVNDGPT